MGLIRGYGGTLGSLSQSPLFTSDLTDKSQSLQSGLAKFENVTKKGTLRYDV